MNEPRFTHDCDNCVFLGQFKEYDLYFCEQGGRPTVVGRYGSDGPEYNSGMPFGINDTWCEDCFLPCLVEARKRAIARNLTASHV